MSQDREAINMLVAGKDFPWEYIAGFYLLFSKLFSFAEVVGHAVKGNKAFGAYGVASVELPNPDVDANQRMLKRGALLGQGHYLLLDNLWSDVGWYPTSVLMHQSPGPFPPVRCQQSPSLTFTYSQEWCRLLHAPVSLQHSVQDL